MTTDTEALRAQFEQYVNPDGDVNMHWLAAGFYAGMGVQQSWLDFQAGHAAAKAEIAAAVAAERGKCAGIVNELRMESARRNMPESATMLWHAEDAIRAGAKGPSDAETTGEPLPLPGWAV